MVEGRVVVHRRGEDRVRRGHPWIYRSDVDDAEPPAPGALVAVENIRGRRIGSAFYSSRSEIRLRLVARGDDLAGDWLERRLAAAIERRRQLGVDAEAFRLCHGEADGVPGLVVDRYRDWLVLQTLTQGTDRIRDRIVAALREELHPTGMLARNDPKVRELEGLPREVAVLDGNVPEEIEIASGPARFGVDLRGGQKTGLFLDQRENHVAAARYARGRVLDAFCYAGGFALQMAPSADSVVAVDVSAEAVARARDNAARSSAANVTAATGNVFDLLREFRSERRRFDTIVLDPPAFAKNKRAVDQAVRGYKEINLRALQLLDRGGVLITCSCSYHVSWLEFEALLAAAAADAGIRATIVERRTQAVDHPIALGIPETAYLKCLILHRSLD